LFRRWQSAIVIVSRPFCKNELVIRAAGRKVIAMRHVPQSSNTTVARVDAPTSVRRREALRKRVWRKRHYYLYLLPLFLLLGIFSYFPPIMAFFYSVHEWDGVTLRPVGLQNFIELAGDPVFRRSTSNVLVFLVASIVTSLIPSLIVAELLFSLRSKGAEDFYRTLFLIPTLVPTIVITLTWRYIYHPQFGFINEMLSAVGLEDLRYDWLGSFNTVVPALIFIGFPWVQGTSVLILVAALYNIPSDIMESYRLDARGVWKRIWHIDLPLISGAIGIICVLTIINTLQGLTYQFAITGGGPGRASTVPAFYMYREAFYNGRFGYASAIGVVLFVIILAVTLLSARLFRSRVDFDPPTKA